MAAAACARGSAPEDAIDAALITRYAPPPGVRSFPMTADSINSWIASGDTTRIRQHAWDIWESLTSPSPANPAVPVWETWYTGREIFEQDSTPAELTRDVAVTGEPAAPPIVRDASRHRFEWPHQTTLHPLAHVRRIPVSGAERWFSCNRYTLPTARFIVQRKLFDWQTLADTNRAFTRRGTPVALREVRVSPGIVDATSFVLKPVFQFIYGKVPSCIPYWGGDTQGATSNPNNPIAMTWKQFVIVDPVDSLKGASRAMGTFPGCPTPAQSWPVAPVGRFYSVRITQAMVDDFSVFAETSGDFLGAGADTAVRAIRQMVRPGNLGVLLALHVTGKEISNWTWQTFWWSPTPDDSLGYDRPPTIAPPWDNYQMNTAYQMVTPERARAKGTPRVAYNPYLETSLCSSPVPAHSTQAPCTGSSWYGVQSNCMSCHRQAAWKDTVVFDPGTKRWVNSLTAPAYVPAQFVDPGDPATFRTYTKTDFLWSVAIRTTNTPPLPPGERK